MKIKPIFVTMLAVVLLAGCQKHESAPNGQSGDYDEAFVAFKVSAPTMPTRAGSGEQTGEDFENALSALYAVIFDADDKVINHDKESPLLELRGTPTAPDPVRVLSTAKKILVIANPGTELLKVLKNTRGGQTFAQLNEAIALEFTTNTAARPEILVDELRTLAGNKTNPTYSDFTMINSGGLATIDKIYVVGTGTGEYSTEQEAREAAMNATNKQKIQVERMTAKLVVKDGGGNITKPQGSYFQLHTDYWTLDVLNSTFFPYAEKIQLPGAHTPGTGGYYTSAFYTKDPNYTGYAGLFYNNLVRSTMAPNVTWMTDSQSDYCIENTMEELEQKYRNATRVILRATYYPDASWSGDWYMYAGKQYRTLELLKEDYETHKNALPTDPANYAFKLACEELLSRAIAASKISGGTEITAASFSDLTQAMLDAAAIEHGGELIKNKDGCVRWYQRGLNYYYFEIRHDNTNDTPMNLGKYGVVRNNCYLLTLQSVKGAGTPWYPSVNPDPDPLHPTYPDPEPDPDPEPKPEDPIDKSTGFVSFEVTVAPWVDWETGMDI